MLSVRELLDFEEEVAAAFDAGEISGPIHLCSPEQAEPLIELFHEVRPEDWVLSTWRSHWHALLKGVPREDVMGEILNGRSMMLHFPKHKFMTSAIMGGLLPIAVGLAAAGEKVWCFVGDMGASTGAFRDAWKYAHGHNLTVTFIVEDNGLSTNSPTAEVWGSPLVPHPPGRNLVRGYQYKRTVSHYGTGKYVPF